MADIMKFVLRLGWFRIPFAIEVPDPDAAGGDPNQPGTPAYYASVASRAASEAEAAAARAEAAAGKFTAFHCNQTLRTNHRFAHAAQAGTAGLVLHRAFHKAFSLAKRVRKMTLIGCGPVSIGSAVVRLTGKIFHSLSGKTVIILGSGKIAEIAARSLNRIEIGTAADREPDLQKCRRTCTRTWRYRRSVREFDGSSERGGPCCRILIREQACCWSEGIRFGG